STLSMIASESFCFARDDRREPWSTHPMHSQFPLRITERIFDYTVVMAPGLLWGSSAPHTKQPGEAPGLDQCFRSLGCGSFRSAGDLGLGFEPIFLVMAVFGAARYIEFVGTRTNLFFAVGFGRGAAGYRSCLTHVWRRAWHSSSLAGWRVEHPMGRRGGI